MKAKTLSKGELRAGITEEELLHTTDKMLTEYLMGKRARDSAESLISEFERSVAEDHPTPPKGRGARTDTYYTDWHLAGLRIRVQWIT